MRIILRDENCQKELMQRGYTKVPLLSDAETTNVLNRIHQLNSDNKFNPDGSQDFGTTLHITHLDKDLSYRKSATNLLYTTFLPYLEKHLVDYKFLAGNLFVKPPGKGELGIHQNWHFTDNLDDITLSLWCPLVDVDETNGTIQVVEGSHRILPEIPNPFCKPYFSDFIESLVKNHSKPISLKAGECLIFDDSLLHWSGVNNSSSPRYVVQGLFIPAEAVSVLYYLNQNHPQKQFEMFEISSDSFVEERFIDLMGNPEKLKRLGFVENKNRLITEEEFLQLLRKSNKDRKRIQSSESATKPKHSVFLERIKSFFRHKVL